jgi:SSS family solute:Na+ symporter
VGIAFAAIAIGALVPAAIMSIASANLFTRNIWKEYFDPNCPPARESQVAKIVSIFVKAGALFFIIGLPVSYAIQFQLLGGVLIIQTLPAVLLGLYFPRLHPWALLAGWIVGISSGTAMAAASHFQTSTYVLHLFGMAVPCYAALSSLGLNIAVSVVLSVVFNLVASSVGTDATVAEDYI